MANQENGGVHPLVAAGQMMVVPGVYDVLSAKLAARAGFPAVVLTGYGVAASFLGEPDFGLLTQSEILDTARRVTAAVSIGVIVDGDTGYGGPLNVQRMVRELVAMGARGILLEDQVWPKRCGHMRGKEVVPAEEHAATSSWRRRIAPSGPGCTRRPAPTCSSWTGPEPWRSFAGSVPSCRPPWS